MKRTTGIWKKIYYVKLIKVNVPREISQMSMEIRNKLVQEEEYSTLEQSIKKVFLTHTSL